MLASVGQEVQSVFALAYPLAIIIIIKLPSYTAYSGVSFSVCLLQSALVITTEAYHFEKHFRDSAPSEYLSVCLGKDDPTIDAVLAAPSAGVLFASFILLVPFFHFEEHSFPAIPFRCVS